MQTRFVVVAGPPCAGKSFVARHVSNELAAPHLEMDRFRRRVLPLSDLRVEHRDIAYRAMHVAAELMAPLCPVLILDATYTAAVCRRDLMQVVERVKGGLYVIECHVDATVAVERFVRRGDHPAVDLTPQRVAMLADGYRYCAGAFAVGGRSQGADLSSVVQYVRGLPLDRARRIRWERRGGARERALEPPRSARVAAEMRWPR